MCIARLAHYAYGLTRHSWIHAQYNTIIDINFTCHTSLIRSHNQSLTKPLTFVTNVYKQSGSHKRSATPKILYEVSNLNKVFKRHNIGLKFIIAP